jgi:hypothetical protein
MKFTQKFGSNFSLSELGGNPLSRGFRLILVPFSDSYCGCRDRLLACADHSIPAGTVKKKERKIPVGPKLPYGDSLFTTQCQSQLTESYTLLKAPEAQFLNRSSRVSPSSVW